MQEQTGLVQNGGPNTQGMLAVAASREAQEIQAAMVVAQRCPRNQDRALDAILTACKRPTLAEKAMYAYPRGAETVTGPSIRLAETLAQLWGNMQFGIQEVENRPGKPGVAGESVMKAYCWDMETNVRREMTFTVRHIRDKKSGNQNLTSERDIYELVANQGARRLRACILAVIPGDIVEAAENQCEKTLKGGKDPLNDRLKSMLASFAEIGVAEAMIEKRLGHKIATTSETELVNLRKIFTSIRDNYADKGDFFDGAGGSSQNSNSDAPPAQIAAETISAPKEAASKPKPFNHAPGANNSPAPAGTGTQAGSETAGGLPNRTVVGKETQMIFQKLGMKPIAASEWVKKRTGHLYNDLNDVEAVMLLDDLKTFAIENGVTL